jgi:hypothetical protein
MGGSLGENSTDFPLSAYSIKIFTTVNCIPNLAYPWLFDGSQSSKRVGKGSRYLMTGRYILIGWNCWALSDFKAPDQLA